MVLDYSTVVLKYSFILCLIQTAIGSVATYDITEAPPRKMDDIEGFTGNTYCKFQANRYRCGHYLPERKYYFDLNLRECIQFEYGNCKFSYNVFKSRTACLTECRDVAYQPVFTNLTENVYCRFQPQFGDCNDYHPMFYFDVSDYQCKGFSYSGCGGNFNRFSTAQICAAVCGSVIKVI